MAHGIRGCPLGIQGTVVPWLTRTAVCGVPHAVIVAPCALWALVHYTALAPKARLADLLSRHGFVQNVLLVPQI